jgi:alpha-1,6-mannosyltransferase
VNEPAAPPAARTLHVTNAWHATSGGIRTFYRALLTAASDRGRMMTLVVPGDASGVEVCDRWTSIHHVAARRAPWFDRRYRLLRTAHYRGPASPVGRVVTAMRPDLVEVCDKYTLVPLARWLRAGRFGVPPTVVGLSCERMDDNVEAYVAGGRPVRGVARAWMRHVYVPSFDAHVANSAYTAGELQAAGAAAAVCGMGVDATTFLQASRDDAWRSHLLETAGGTATSVLVLYAGRLSPEKHLDLLVHAVGHAAHRDRAPDLRLVLAGEGPDATRIETLARAVAPGRVRLIGNVSDRAALATLYASADVFAHPNHREPFGIGPLEAMAAGVPVVVPDAGGVRTYASDGNAWLAAPEAATFATAILDAAGAGRGADRVRAARETARAFDWPVMARRYFDTLDRLHAARLAGASVAAGA